MLVRLLFFVALTFGLIWLWRVLVPGLRKVVTRPLTGKTIENHSNGRMKSERQFKDGMMHGPWILWDENGNKLAEGAYDRGIVHGTEIDYASNGVKARETPWAYGRRHGTAKVYDSTGKILKLLTYIHSETDKPTHDGPASDAELKTPPP